MISHQFRPNNVKPILHWSESHWTCNLFKSNFLYYFKTSYGKGTKPLLGLTVYVGIVHISEVSKTLTRKDKTKGKTKRKNKMKRRNENNKKRNDEQGKVSRTIVNNSSHQVSRFRLFVVLFPYFLDLKLKGRSKVYLELS